MKYILKNSAREPQSLRDYRSSTPNASYVGLPGNIKQDLRNVLVEEQGFICAYCMGRIEPSTDKMDIEHFITQKRHVDSQYDEQTHRNNQLRYTNLLGTCRQPRCCSEIRRNVPLTINPMNQSCERLVRFRRNGEAFSSDPRIQKDLDDILKLNDQTLKENRCVVIDFALKKLERKYQKKDWNNNRLDSEIAEWSSKKNTRLGLAYEPYCMAAINYIESKKSK